MHVGVCLSKITNKNKENIIEESHLNSMASVCIGSLQLSGQTIGENHTCIPPTIHCILLRMFAVRDIKKLGLNAKVCKSTTRS